MEILHGQPHKKAHQKHTALIVLPLKLAIYPPEGWVFMLVVCTLTPTV